jgi:pimeloyl-ACP methyl ester carboxylesterase
VNRTERINRIDLYVRRFGDPALPVLVVVHGGPTWDHSYLLPVTELSDIAHVVLFDLRGCGLSSHDVPLQPDLIADDVAALIRHIGAGKADVLGFSYGGGVAMRVADQHPEVLDRLILASTTAYPEMSATVPPERAAMRGEVDWAMAEKEDGDLSRAMADADLPVMIWRLDREQEWREILAGVRFSSAWNTPYREGKLKPARPADPPGVLRRWGGDVLILHGEREMAFPVEAARRLHAEVPGSRLMLVPEAAHMAQFDNPQAWLRAVREFLGRPDGLAS